MILRAEQIRKSYHNEKSVLSNVNLTIEQGQFVALLGPSGSGKTTLLRCLTLLEKPSAGRIYFNETELLNLSAKQTVEVRRKWAYIGQRTSLIRRKSALNNVLAGRLNEMPLWKVILGNFPDADKEKALQALERVGLKDMAHQRADRLSGGQQQRVAIARAIVQEAVVIYADEPVASLDPESAKRVLADLRMLCEETGTTILCSLHQVDLAETYATRIVGLSDGKIALDIPARLLTEEEKDRIYTREEQTNGDSRTKTTTS